jgi:Sortase domain
LVAIVGTASAAPASARSHTASHRTHAVGASLGGPGATARGQHRGTTNGCSFATPGTGTYANTLCWLDLSAYDPTQAASPGGQPFTVTLPGGYSITFDLHVSGDPVKPAAFPTYPGAFLGNRGFYTGVGGKPALYQTRQGSTTTAELDNIAVTGPDGGAETGYAFVGADAETTDATESITWQSNTPLNLISNLGNACDSGALFVGNGTKIVKCSATVSNNKTGTPMLAAQAPTSISQTMVGAGLEGVAFGVLVSDIQLTKNVVSRVSPSDSWNVAIHSSSNDLIASGSTGTSNTGSTGLVTVLTSQVGASFNLSEAIGPGLLSNYNGSWSCTRNGVADPALPSGDAGTSASVTLGVGDFVDCTITNTGKPRSLTLHKIAGTPTDVNGNGLTDTGDTIAYSFAVTNTGVLPLANISVTDAKVGPVSCPVPILLAGQSETCTADNLYTVTNADVAAGQVANTAVASGTAPGTATRTNSNPSSTTTPTEAPAPRVSIVKTAIASDGNRSAPRAGETIAYSYLVTNIGNVRLTSVAVDDPSNNPVTCPAIPPPGLAIGDSVTCTADNLYNVTPGDIANGFVEDTATATGTGDTGGTSPPSDPSTVIIKVQPAAPEVAISKRAVVSPAADQDAAQLGDTITYSYLVTNIGNVNLTSVAVDDPTIGPVTCPAVPAGGLAPGASVTCTANNAHTVVQADIDAGQVTDTATATGVGQAGGTSPPSTPSTATVPTVAAAPAVSIQKSGAVDPPADQGGVKVGDTITYSYVVTNTGNVTLDSVAVVDPTIGPVTCPDVSSGLAVGDSVTCTADKPYTVAQADVDAGQVTDTATATGHGLRGGDSDPSAPSTVTIPAADVLSLSLQKGGLVTPFGNQRTAMSGNTIHYLYLVTNTGTVTLTTVSVVDPTLGPVNCPTPAPPGLAPLHTIVCIGGAPHTITPDDVANGSVDDTATATGSDAQGRPTPPAQDSVSIPAGPALPLVEIAKNGVVSPKSHQHGAHKGDKIAYTYLVTNIGNLPLASVAVQDPKLGSVTCPTLTTPLQPGHAVTCNADKVHTVTAADAKAGKVVDTATATGTDPNGMTSPRSVPSTVTIPVKPYKPPPPPPHHTGGKHHVKGGLAAIGTDLGRWLPPGAGARAFFIGLFALVLAVSTALMIAEHRRRRPLRMRFVVLLVAAALGLAVFAAAAAGGSASAMVLPGSGAARGTARHAKPAAAAARRAKRGRRQHAQQARLVIPQLGVHARLVATGAVGKPGTASLTIPSDVHTVGWWDGVVTHGTTRVRTAAPAPGDAGVAIIAGHVDSAAAGPGALYRLERLDVGDRIRIVGLDRRTTTWVVRSKPRLTLKASLPRTLFKTTGKPRLALVTCGGPFDAATGHYRDNLIAWATPAAGSGRARR